MLAPADSRAPMCAAAAFPLQAYAQDFRDGKSLPSCKACAGMYEPTGEIGCDLAFGFGPLTNIRRCRHAVRLFPAVLSANPYSRVRRAAVPEPFLGGLDSAGFPIDWFCDGATRGLTSTVM
jgi:hypothetical protein